MMKETGTGGEPWVRSPPGRDRRLRQPELDLEILGANTYIASRTNVLPTYSPPFLNVQEDRFVVFNGRVMVLVNVWVSK